MFENTNLVDTALREAATGVDSSPLRAFAWPELVARLAATRDVRTVLADARPAAGGSFLKAEKLLDASGAHPNCKNEKPINLVGLTDGKAGDALSAPTAAHADHVDREAQ